MLTTANALSTMGDALVNATGSDQVKSILDKKLTAEFLMSLDMDGSGDVTEFEYLSAMLIRLNHVDEDQIDRIMKAFRKLDTDGSGSLNVKDLAGNLKSERNKTKQQESVKSFIPDLLDEKEVAANNAWAAAAEPGKPAEGEGEKKDVVAEAEELLEEKVSSSN